MGHPPKLKTWNSSRRKGSGSWSRGKGNDGFRSEACFVCMTGNIIRRIDRTRSQLRNVACVTGFPVVRSAPLKPKSGLNGTPAQIENLEFIKAEGIRKLVEREGKRWFSKRGVLCVHDRKYYPQDR